MPLLQDISVDTVAFPWANRAPRRAIQSSIAVALALVVGHFTGHASAGAIAAGAAFTVGFAVFHEAMASTLLSMALVTAGIASATLIGSTAAQWTPGAVLVVIVASVNYGLLADLSPTAGWIGQQCAVFAIIASGFPLGRDYAVGRASMVVVGGLLQFVVYAISYRIRHVTYASKDAPLLHQRVTTRIRALWRGVTDSLRSASAAATVSYIGRLALTLVLATLYYRRHHLANGYWAPMTAVLVLKPIWTGTLSRGAARLLGTVAGATVAVLSALYLHATTPIVFALVMITAWASYAVQAVNYALFSFFLTLYIVYSFRFGGFSQPSAAHLRMLNTAIGGGLALAVDFTWLAVSFVHERLLKQTGPQKSEAR